MDLHAKFDIVYFCLLVIFVLFLTFIFIHKPTGIVITTVLTIVYVMIILPCVFVCDIVSRCISPQRIELNATVANIRQHQVTEVELSV